MICRLCLKDLQDVVYIFDAKGREQKIAFVIGKHFWFEPRRDDPISTVVCQICWRKLCDFHNFYDMVEDAQRHMTDIIVKTENAKSKRRSIDELVSCNSLPKPEPDDDDEVPFNMLIEDVAIALGADDSLSHHEFSRDDDQEKFESHNDVSLDFDGEAFMKNILTNKPKDTVDIDKEENDEAAAPMPEKRRRSSRNAIKSPDMTISSEENSENVGNIVRRGRPKKGHIVGKGNSKPKRRMDDPKKTADSDMYKIKMKEIDDQISRYMTLYCDVCNAAVNNFAGLRIHMREHGIGRGYAKCCNKKFLKRALLLDHIRQHLDPECYRCEDCDKSFADRQSMRNHFLIKHQKEEDKKFECSQCSKKFVKKYLLEQHKIFSHRDRTTTCKTCNRRFETLDELVEHNKVHCNYGTMCDICAKVIRGPAAFKRHQLEHQGVQFPKVQCDLCGSWHKDKYALNKHKKRHMESKQPHICDICQKVSPSRSAMLSHKRYVHGTEKSYECGICRKSFKKQLSLREHMTTHTGEVLYRCPHCPKTFNSNANMHAHRKKIHPREFEQTRKLRKQNAHLNLNQQPIPPISVLSNAKTDTQALLIIESADNSEPHNVLITTSNPEGSFNDVEVSNLPNKEECNRLLYSIC